MNKFKIIEINEDFENSALTNPNQRIKIKENIDCDSIYNNPLSKYLLCLIIINLILLIILINAIIKVKFFSSSKIKNENTPNIWPYSPSETSSQYYTDKTRYDKETKYDKKGKQIYSSTGTLSFNKLDEIYYKKKLNISKFNHIHVAMSFDEAYHLLSTVTIASLLKNAKSSTYIHLHIIAVDGFTYKAMKKLNSLKKKINNNTEFIFHNGDKVQKDFGKHIRNGINGVGEYARFLAPYFANETDRIIVTDSADLIFKRDLLELYNYPLEDKLVKGVIDPYIKCFPEYEFFHKEKYFNGGVLLFNAKRWREMNIYQDIVNFYKGFKYKDRMPTPIQDILNTFFPAISVGLLPLKFNLQGVVDSNDDSDFQGIYPENNIHELNCSIFYKKRKKIFKYEKNVVIRHLNKYKVHTGESSYIIREEWSIYAKMTGFYQELCSNYPLSCNYFENINFNNFD